MNSKLLTKISLGLVCSLLAVANAQAQNVSKRDSVLALQRNAISLITPGQGTSKPGSTIGFWGYAFGDYAYMTKGDSAGRGTKQQYKGLGAAGQTPDQNAFEIRRTYLGFDYKINKTFTAYALLAYEGDQDVSDNRTVYIKYMYMKWKNIWKGTDLKVGQQATNSFATAYNTEPLLGYRAIEKTIMDMHGMDGSSDMGIMLEGKIWTAHAADTSNIPTFIGYSAMVGDNSGNNPVAGFTGAATSLSGASTTSATTSTYTYVSPYSGKDTTVTIKGTTTTAQALNPFNNTTDKAKKFRVNLYVNTLNNALTIGVYGDLINYGNYYYGTTKGYQHSVMTAKAYAAYNSKWFGVGGEFVMQNYTNGEFENFSSKTAGTSDTTTATQIGYSIFAHGTIIQNCLNIFARYDMYTPDNKYSHNVNETFTDISTNVSNSGNGNSYKENFINAGLDWTPTKDKKIHIMPNVWYYGISNGYGSDNLKSDNYMLYRVTFLFAFN